MTIPIRTPNTCGVRDVESHGLVLCATSFCTINSAMQKPGKSTPKQNPTERLSGLSSSDGRTSEDGWPSILRISKAKQKAKGCEKMREYQKRAMIIKSSRIRFLENWVRSLPTRDPDEVRHAIMVFAQARWKVSKRTSRKYAMKVLRIIRGEGVLLG